MVAVEEKVAVITANLSQAVCFQFPEDAQEARVELLSHWRESPCETWIRAYAFTMSDLAAAVVEANKVAPQHVYMDRSQYDENLEQKTLAKQLVAEGVEVTIGTSPAGADYIAHTKAWFRADGLCWEGSLNFSESAWYQVNTAFCFLCPAWRDMMLAAFHRDVAYAWEHERRYQVMSKPPGG